jgi:hypothetical protein
MQQDNSNKNVINVKSNRFVFEYEGNLETNKWWRVYHIHLKLTFQ